MIDSHAKREIIECRLFSVKTRKMFTLVYVVGDDKETTSVNATTFVFRENKKNLKSLTRKQLFN